MTGSQDRLAGNASEASPLVSVVTPTLNQGRFIGDAIASIKAQTYPNVEHIVVDGGSTDSTLDRLREEEGRYRLRWRSEPDRGMYEAINKGLAVAAGEILGYLNSDDVYVPWAIQTAVNVFAANPNADLVFGDGLTVDEASGRQRLALIPALDGASLAVSASLVQPAAFWRRRALVELGGFDADLRFVGDLDFWLRLGKARQFVRVDEVLAIERHHDAALSRASSSAMAEEAARVRLEHRRALGSVSMRSALAARSRAALGRRLLWLRFLRSVRARDRGGMPWGQFIAHGAVEVDPKRVCAMFIPRVGSPFAWDAVRSGRTWFS